MQKPTWVYFDFIYLFFKISVSVKQILIVYSCLLLQPVKRRYHMNIRIWLTLPLWGEKRISNRLLANMRYIDTIENEIQ